MTRYDLRRSKGLCGRNGCERYSGTHSLCPQHLAEQIARSAKARIELRGLPHKNYHRALNMAGVALVAFCLLPRPATADEAPAPQSAANALQCACPESENGARPGETLEQRAARLEMQWRLTRAERWVRAKNARRK